jgi:hypothetical protein
MQPSRIPQKKINEKNINQNKKNKTKRKNGNKNKHFIKKNLQEKF